MDLVDRANSTFTKREPERLTAYRAAVVAGFYTDWDGSAETADTDVLAWLGDDDGVHAATAYPFTAAERQRLERCRAAVVGGYYRDDQPPAEAGTTPEQPTR